MAYNPLYGREKADDRLGMLKNPGAPPSAIGTGAQTITIDISLYPAFFTTPLRA